MAIREENKVNQRSSVHLPLQLSGVLLGVTILAGTGCNLASATDDTVVDIINATVPVACTISGSTDHTYSTSMMPDTTETLGPSRVKSVCNDVAGYSLYAIGFTGDSYTGDNTKMVGTLANINTGTSGPDSYWAMKVEAIPGDYAPTITNSFNNYHTVPSTFTQIAKFTSITDNTVGSNLDITYQVHASLTQTADTYTGKVKYVLVHPNNAPTPMTPLPDSACPASSICYAPNSSDIEGSMSSMGAVTGSDTAGKQTGVPNNGTATLIAPNFSREGYGFAGWSTDFEATSSSIVFGPNQTITTSTSGTGDANVSQKGLILYPVWIASAGNLQGWTGCSTLTQASYNSETGVLSATLASMTALTDERDGDTYTVARLADGNCWMTENLRLNAEDTTGDTNKALAQGYGTSATYGNFIGLANSEDANFNTNTTANSLYYSGTQSGTATMNIGTTDYPVYRIPRYNKNNTNLASGATNSAGTALTDSYNTNNDHVRWYGYGNYYNWPAAMANTIYYSSPTATDADGKTSETVGTSICPSSWKLPYGRDTGNGATSGGFSYLDIQMGGTGTSSSTNAVTGGTMSTYWRHFPNNFVYSGYFGDSSATGRSSYGRYWSSTASDSGSSYDLRLGSSNVRPGTSGGSKYSGFSVRCIAGS